MAKSYNTVHYVLDQRFPTKGREILVLEISVLVVNLTEENLVYLFTEQPKNLTLFL